MYECIKAREKNQPNERTRDCSIKNATGSKKRLESHYFYSKTNFQLILYVKLLHNIFLFIILLTCIHTPGICVHILPWFIFYLFNLYLPFENKQNLYHPWNLLWPSQYLGTSFPLGHHSPLVLICIPAMRPWDMT